MRPSLAKAKRIVVKIGTNLLAGENQQFHSGIAESIAAQFRSLRQEGREVILVSSGAIGLGASKIGVQGRVENIAMRQACAAIGQPLLMAKYNEFFSSQGINTAQVLLTRELLNKRESFLNIQATIEHLLRLGIVPICNENDSVSIAEIGPVFGDNDNLSAHIASKLDADLLVLLTDIDAMYTADPRRDSSAQPLPLVEAITPEILASATGSGSSFGTGGMKTKLEAIQTASRAGTQVIIADGRIPDVLLKLVDDKEIGTLFLAGPRRKSRERWILNTSPAGRIIIDAGAEQALQKGKSLLPSGILSVEKSFSSGDVIKINDSFQAISRLDSNQVEKIIGLHSSEIAHILANTSNVVAHADDIVAIGPADCETKRTSTSVKGQEE